MKTREEIMKEVQWQLDEIEFVRQMYHCGDTSMVPFVRMRKACSDKIIMLLWVIGEVDDVQKECMPCDEVEQLELALLDNANTIHSLV